MINKMHFINVLNTFTLYNMMINLKNHIIHPLFGY